MRVASRVWVWVAGGVLLGALGACSTESIAPAPMVTPTQTSMQTSPPASTALPVALTPEQTIREFMRLEDIAQNSGATAPVRMLAPRCRPCLSFLRQVDRIYSHGGRIKVEGTRVVRLTPISEDRDAHIVDMTYSFGKTVIWRRAGAAGRTLYGGRDTDRLLLVKVGDKWLIQDYLSDF